MNVKSTSACKRKNANDSPIIANTKKCMQIQI
jgi:hypothetical protein